MGLFSSAHYRQGVLQFPWTSGAGKTRVKVQGIEAGAYLPWKNRDRPPLAGQVEDVTACRVTDPSGPRGVFCPEAVAVHVLEVSLTRDK